MIFTARKLIVMTFPVGSTLGKTCKKNNDYYNIIITIITILNIKYLKMDLLASNMVNTVLNIGSL